MKSVKEQAIEERGPHPTPEVPEYAHELDHPFSVRTPPGMREFLQAYFRAGWDGMHQDGEPYFHGEALRCYERYDTVWRIKTVEEAADMLWRIESWATTSTHGIESWTVQEKQACQRILQELRENLDAEELEEKLENTEYGNPLDVIRDE